MAKESNYGSFTGNFDIPRDHWRHWPMKEVAGRLFESELLAVLKMIDGGVSQSAMTGSWAGAMGKPQFLAVRLSPA